MRSWEIFRFEIAYQSRRVSTWLYFAVLLTLTYYVARQIYIDNARSDGYFFNAPFVIAVMTLLGSMMGLLSATQLAGDAAARDVQTRMDPLFYTSPVGKTAYLRGRFLAAFILYAVILLAVPLGLLLAAVVPGPEAELIGPFRPAAYLGAYLFLALRRVYGGSRLKTGLRFAALMISYGIVFSLALIGLMMLTVYRLQS